MPRPTKTSSTYGNKHAIGPKAHGDTVKLAHQHAEHGNKPKRSKRIGKSGY